MTLLIADASSANDRMYHKEVHTARGTRLTFTFKTEAVEKPFPVAHLITERQQPDLLIINSGAWDCYDGHDASTSAHDYSEWIRAVR